MELLMKHIHMCRQARESEVQLTLEEDLNVPDAKPDVEQIVQRRGRILIGQTRAENGKLYIEGTLETEVLYMEDTKERRLQRLNARLPFETEALCEGLEAGDEVRLEQELEDLDVSLINSRKLAIRALLTFRFSVEELYDLSAAVSAKSSARLCEQRKKLELLQLVVQKKDILRLKQESTLPADKPDIGEILWENIQLRSCRIRLLDGKISVSGKLFLFVLFRGADEAAASQYLEQVLPFEEELSCSGSSPELIADISHTLTRTKLQAKEDGDGEMRVLYLEGVLELGIRLYQNGEADLIEDVYSPEKSLELTTSEETYETLVMKNDSQCQTSGKIRIQGTKPRILQICHATGEAKIDQMRILEEGVEIEGVVPVSILYISAEDDAPFAVLDGMVPFSHTARIPGLDKDCRLTWNTSVDQLTATMSDSEEIEVKLVICLDILAVRPMKQICILKIEEKDYTTEQLEAIPGITGYIVQEGDTLWKIARAYFLAPEQIVEMNGLERDEVSPGDRLILMKNVSGLQGKENG